jgi:hypothetical protein
VCRSYSREVKMLEFLVAAVIDVLVAFALGGCVWGLARAWDRRPGYLRLVAWTAIVMCALAAWGESEIAASGKAAADPANVVPLLIFSVVVYLVISRHRSGATGPGDAAAAAPELEAVEAELAG